MDILEKKLLWGPQISLQTAFDKVEELPRIMYIEHGIQLEDEEFVTSGQLIYAFKGIRHERLLGRDPETKILYSFPSSFPIELCTPNSVTPISMSKLILKIQKQYISLPINVKFSSLKLFVAGSISEAICLTRLEIIKLHQSNYIKYFSFFHDGIVLSEVILPAYLPDIVKFAVGPRGDTPSDDIFWKQLQWFLSRQLINAARHRRYGGRRISWFNETVHEIADLSSAPRKYFCHKNMKIDSIEYRPTWGLTEEEQHIKVPFNLDLLMTLKRNPQDIRLRHDQEYHQYCKLEKDKVSGDEPSNRPAVASQLSSRAPPQGQTRRVNGFQLPKRQILSSRLQTRPLPSLPPSKADCHKTSPLGNKKRGTKIVKDKGKDKTTKTTPTKKTNSALNELGMKSIEPKKTSGIMPQFHGHACSTPSGSTESRKDKNNQTVTPKLILSFEGLSISGVVDEVLVALNLEKHAETFHSNCVDGQLLSNLSIQEMVDCLGLNTLESRRLWMFLHENYRPKL